MEKSLRVDAIKDRLYKAFSPSILHVNDDSHLHAGHEGAKTGKGHFSVRVVSSQFSGKLPLARHRMVYEALGEMMQEDIHALSIHAESP